MGKKLATLLDHVTDVAGITALTILGLNGALDPSTVAGIVSIAVGQRYAKGKWLNHQTGQQ
jgi:hypothetical protein